MVRIERACYDPGMGVLNDKRVAWVGVVMVHDDGSTYAVELDGTRQRIRWEVKTEFEYASDLTGPPLEQAVEVRVIGVGRPWAAGERSARAEALRSYRAAGLSAGAIEAGELDRG